MKRARWMLGALGALAAVSLVPAGAQAASAPSPIGFSTEITSAVDGSRWADFGGDPVIKAAPFGVFGDADKWVVSNQYDGSVTIRNQQTNRCAQANLQWGPEVLAVPCLPGSPSQRWIVEERAAGYVISPRATPDLAVSVEQPNSPAGSWLKLEPRWDLNGSSTAKSGQVFRFGI
ncbi:RICIN domain-containing protein [Saccharopolyspora pogona]|uniref:RICIN domain-containing protein n=1 Tax=Saccharopolyspora pogona TaxID=333966 RepID=UPI001688993B|nr:RICIN domain-containing protein [Saccharopolyspora pogona]